MRAVSLLLLASLSVLSACRGTGLGTPSENDARAFLASRIDDGRADRVELASFSKTDAVAGETAGVRTYTMDFVATAQTKQDVYLMLQSPFDSVLRGLTVLELPVQDGFIPQMRPPEFDYATKLAPGTQVQLSGKLLFEKHESGWVATDLGMQAARGS